ncbi:MAG: phosphoglycerate dehydrogenase [Actinomycetota bacterium]
MTDRVLVAEPLSERGLEAMRAAGLEVDVRTGCSPTELAEAIRGAKALVIRSATQVDAGLLAAATDLVVVGRAGIGLHNVDVAEATRRGVMVVNAPQSNILSAAEHTLALLLAQARNVPQADADLKAGRWNRSEWEGVELHGKSLGIVGLGRVGVLVAQRALAFGMQLFAYDPFVSDDRARQLGVKLVPTVTELVRTCDFVSIHATKTPETVGLVSAAVLAEAKPGLRIVNAGRGGIIDEAALADALRSGRLGGAAIDTFAAEPTTESDLFSFPNVVVTPHLGASTAEAQDKAGETIAEQVILALRGDFVPFAVNVAAASASETVRPFLPLAERLGRLFTGLAGGAVGTLSVTFEGDLAAYDCGVLTLAVLKGVLGPVVDEPVSFVNAPQIAERRGLSVRETKAADARDFVNLIEVHGDQGTHVAATLFGAQQAPRIVGIDGNKVDLPPARFMLVVHNRDVPNMIGQVTSTLGGSGINISDIHVGRSPAGEAALMAIATDGPVPPAIVDRINEIDGVSSARAIDLGA